MQIYQSVIECTSVVPSLTVGCTPTGYCPAAGLQLITTDTTNETYVTGDAGENMFKNLRIFISVLNFEH